MAAVASYRRGVADGAGDWTGSGRRGLLQRFYLPAYFLLCLLIGGSTKKFVLADAILLVAGLPLVWLAAGEFGRLAPRFRWFAAALVACVAVQLIPGSGLLSSDSIPAFVGPITTALTRDVGRTVDTLLILVLALSAFTVFMNRPVEEQIKIMRVLLLGAALQLVAATLQYGSQSGINLSALFGYDMTSGFFRNRNHFSDFMLATIPVAAFLSRRWEQPAFLYAWALLIIFASFVVGSDAGIALAIAITFISVMALREKRRRLILPAVIILPLLVGAFVYLRGDLFALEADAEVSRLTIAADTIEAISHYLPLGSGYGTFEIVYPQFEKAERILNAYINHAHNDYLELVLEGGVPALVLIAAYFALLAGSLPRALASPLKVSALIAILAILLHSIVDFPLRNIAILISFAFFNAVYFAPPAPTGPSTTTVVEGRRRRVPLRPQRV